jgi:hypothetical protein
VFAFDVDVRVVLRRGHVDALEVSHADADFRDDAIVPELRIPLPDIDQSPCDWLGVAQTLFSHDAC